MTDKYKKEKKKPTSKQHGKKKGDFQQLYCKIKTHSKKEISNSCIVKLKHIVIIFKSTSTTRDKSVKVLLLYEDAT